MLFYIDEDDNKYSCGYPTIEEKIRIIAELHKIAEAEMREQELEKFKYAIIDFKESNSTVFELERQVTEKFSRTAC